MSEPSDGQTVWLVFDYDGYEGASFRGAFGVAVQAEQFAEEWRKHYRKLYSSDGGWDGRIHVVKYTLGDARLPPKTEQEAQ